MDKILINTLRQLGCNDKHIRLYRASLLQGVATLPELTKLARLQRSTAYIIVDELLTKGLLLEDHQVYRKQYTAVEPDVLQRMLDAKYRQLGRTNLALKEVLPELRAAHQATSIRPRVRTFNGAAAHMAIEADVLKTGADILLWSNQAAERQVFNEAEHISFVTNRVQSGLPIRVLAVDNQEARQLIAADNDCLRETRLLPAEVSFTSETYVYGNKIAVLDIGKEIFGIIIENEQMAHAQRAIFELSWQNTGTITD